MLRPASIVTFERCYLGAWLVGLVNLAFGWNGRLATMEAALAARGGPAQASVQAMLPAFLVVGLVVGTAITFALWHFVARVGSEVAKWIVVVLFALGVLGLLSSLHGGTFQGGVAGVLAIVALVLQAVAVAMLFRPDARAWFAEDDDRAPVR